jgi:ABC-type multidrug transport system permease subunit
MCVAAIQIGFGMATGSLLFGVRWGENLWAIALVLAAYASLAACGALLLGNWAKSPGQAVAVAVVLSNGLAAIGGCWWPVEIVPEWAQKAALLTPTGWAMDAIHKLMSFGLPASAVWVHVAVLSAAALGLGWMTARRMKFE